MLTVRLVRWQRRIQTELVKGESGGTLAVIPTRCHRDRRVCLRRCSLDKQRSTALLPAGKVCTFFRSNWRGLCRISQIAFLIFPTALGCAASTTLNNYIRKRFRLHRQRDPEAST